jgi:hypothetical protein
MVCRFVLWPLTSTLSFLSQRNVQLKRFLCVRRITSKCTLSWPHICNEFLKTRLNTQQLLTRRPLRLRYHYINDSFDYIGHMYISFGICVSGNEWIDLPKVFILGWSPLVALGFDGRYEWMSDSCLAPTQQFFSYIMARTN